MRAILNHIIFRFKEEVDAKGMFKKKTSWGLEISGHVDDSTKTPRWVQVIAVGPECKHVKAGDEILVKPLMWSVRFTYEGQQYWRTDESKIVATNNPDTGFKALNDNVIFMRTDQLDTKTASGLEVVGDIRVNTAYGQVVEIGDKTIERSLDKAKVYFLDQNFFTYFEHRGRKFAYIEEMDILAYEPKE